MLHSFFLHYMYIIYDNQFMIVARCLVVHEDLNIVGKNLLYIQKSRFRLISQTQELS